jgi:hypothetical protein
MILKLPLELQYKIYMYALPSIHHMYPTFHRELYDRINEWKNLSYIKKQERRVSQVLFRNRIRAKYAYYFTKSPWSSTM